MIEKLGLRTVVKAALAWHFRGAQLCWPLSRKRIPGSRWGNSEWRLYSVDVGFPTKVTLYNYLEKSRTMTLGSNNCPSSKNEACDGSLLVSKKYNSGSDLTSFSLPGKFTDSKRSRRCHRPHKFRAEASFTRDTPHVCPDSAPLSFPLPSHGQFSSCFNGTFKTVSFSFPLGHAIRDCRGKQDFSRNCESR